MPQSVSHFVRKTFPILPLCSAVPFHFSILWFYVFDFFWSKRVIRTWRIFYFFAKVYSTNYFDVEIRNKTNISINFHYYNLLLLMLKSTLPHIWESLNKKHADGVALLQSFTFGICAFSISETFIYKETRTKDHVQKWITLYENYKHYR